MNLNKLRAEINACDDEILATFTKRMALCRGVADYKIQNGLPIFQRDREDQVLERIRSSADPELSGGAVALFAELMDISKCLQHRRMGTTAEGWTEIPALGKGIVACQGVPGANSETAARQLFPGAEPIFLKEFSDVFRAVESGEADYGIVPIRNSTAGTISAVYALLAEYDVSVAAATTVTIRHCLAAKPGIKAEELTAIRSHPAALQQCDKFLHERGIPVCESGNTAQAAREVMESDEPWGAICSPACAAQYGLEILQSDIADCVRNYTRFFCISRKTEYTRSADVVSVLLTLPHTEGSLCRTLTKFYACGLDLLHLESRPIADGSFEVRFYLDFRGNLSDGTVCALLAELKDSLPQFRLLGNYSYQ